MDAVTNVPPPVNEPVRQYAPGSQDRAVLEARVKEMASQRAELTMTAGGRQRMGGGDRVEIVQPHNHRHVLGELGNVTETDVMAAIDAARPAAPGWRALSYDDRAAIFLKAAELLAGPWQAAARRAARVGKRRVEPGGIPPARGIRAGRHAVQLHLHSRQPADRARADG